MNLVKEIQDHERNDNARYLEWAGLKYGGPPDNRDRFALHRVVEEQRQTAEAPTQFLHQQVHGLEPYDHFARAAEVLQLLAALLSRRPGEIRQTDDYVKLTQRHVEESGQARVVQLPVEERSEHLLRFPSKGCEAMQYLQYCISTYLNTLCRRYTMRVGLRRVQNDSVRS